MIRSSSAQGDKSRWSQTSSVAARRTRMMLIALKGLREQRLSIAGGSRTETRLTVLEQQSWRKDRQVPAAVAASKDMRMERFRMAENR